MANTKKIPQSAVLPYQLENGEPQVLMVTSRGRGRWVLPKGHIEDGQNDREAAIQEAFEEAGVNGRLADTKLGTYSYKKYDRPGEPGYKVKVYPMQVDSLENTWPEMSERDRVWMAFPAAAEAVEEPELKLLLRDFGEMLSSLFIERA